MKRECPEGTRLPTEAKKDTRNWGDAEEGGKQNYAGHEVRAQLFLSVFETNIKGDYRPTAPSLGEYSIRLLSHNKDIYMNWIQLDFP